jgi:hypothetical protein
MLAGMTIDRRAVEAFCRRHHIARWRYSDRPSAKTSSGQRVIAIADKAQQRLCRRSRRMLAEHTPPAKVVVAVARELAGFIWAALQPPTVAPQS